MLIDDRTVPSRVMALRLADSGQEGSVHLIAQDQQSGQPMRPLWSRLVAPRVFDLADQLHGLGLLQVVGGAARIGHQVQAWEVETCPTEIQRGEGSSACSRRTNASRWRASKSLRPRCSTTRWRTLSPWCTGSLSRTSGLQTGWMLRLYGQGQLRAHPMKRAINRLNIFATHWFQGVSSISPERCSS